MILLLAVAPAFASVLLIVVSTRPSFVDRIFPPDACGGAAVVNWSVLDAASLPDTVVCMPGYMLTFERSPDEFLLVPDPGNWLHPPHLQAGEVLVVRAAPGMRKPLVERQAVWVRGRLYRSFGRNRVLDGAYRMKAISVTPMQETK